MPSFRLLETLDIHMILPIFIEQGFVWRISGLQYRGRKHFRREALWHVIASKQLVAEMSFCSAQG
jgi:hypothetical protein